MTLKNKKKYVSLTWFLIHYCYLSLYSSKKVVLPLNNLKLIGRILWNTKSGALWGASLSYAGASLMGKIRKSQTWVDSCPVRPPSSFVLVGGGRVPGEPLLVELDDDLGTLDVALPRRNEVGLIWTLPLHQKHLKIKSLELNFLTHIYIKHAC